VLQWPVKLISNLTLEAGQFFLYNPYSHIALPK